MNNRLSSQISQYLRLHNGEHVHIASLAVSFTGEGQATLGQFNEAMRELKAADKDLHECDSCKGVILKPFTGHQGWCSHGS